MAQAVIADTFEDAVDEALAYKEMDALDDTTIERIAFDYKVDEKKLRQAVSDG